MELVMAIRDSDMEAVRELVADPEWDINARVRVPGTRISVYESHALFEAGRSGSVDMLRVILSRKDLDVNQPAAAVNITTLADACNRGAEAVASVLLDDPRIDANAGSDEHSPALRYACLGGHLAVVELFARADRIRFEDEEALCDTARSCGHGRVAELVAEHLLAKRSMAEIGPRERVAKAWQEFQRVDEDNNGHVDVAELRTLAAALGTPLTEPELAEARVALDTDGNGKVDFEEFVAFWLSDEGGIDPEVVAAAAAVKQRGPSGSAAARAAAGGEAAEAAEWGADHVEEGWGPPSGKTSRATSGLAAEGSGGSVLGAGALTDYA